MLLRLSAPLLSMPSLRSGRRRAVRRAELAGKAEDTRTRRAFIQEMMDRAPNAFGNELDVQAMMHIYPGRF